MVQAATSLVACLYTNPVHFTVPPPNKVCALANMPVGVIHAPMLMEKNISADAHKRLLFTRPTCACQAFPTRTYTSLFRVYSLVVFPKHAMHHTTMYCITL
jgi:hypothetical protein